MILDLTIPQISLYILCCHKHLKAGETSSELNLGFSFWVLIFVNESVWESKSPFTRGSSYCILMKIFFEETCTDELKALSMHALN